MLPVTPLSETLAEFTLALVEDYDVIAMLSDLVEQCLAVLPVTAAGIMIAANEGDLRLMASSSHAMRVLELIEIQARQGPCLDCYTTGQAIVNQDLHTSDTRWPTFAPAARHAGFVTAHALPMRIWGRPMGALNLLGTQPDGLDPAATQAAQALADIAAIAVIQNPTGIKATLLSDQLHHAINGRVLIEQAKGIVAERANLDMSQAFDRLRDHARNHYIRLVTLARDIADGNTRVDTLDQP